MFFWFPLQLLTYFGATDRPDELSFFFNWSVLTQMVNFPWFLNCDCCSPPLLGLIFSSCPSVCFTVAFASFGNSGHVVASVSADFPSNLNVNAPVHLTAFDYSCADWNGLWNYLKLLFQWLISSNLLNILSSCRLEYMSISVLILNIRSCVIHLHSF